MPVKSILNRGRFYYRSFLAVVCLCANLWLFVAGLCLCFVRVCVMFVDPV